MKEREGEEVREKGGKRGDREEERGRREAEGEGERGRDRSSMCWLIPQMAPMTGARL